MADISDVLADLANKIAADLEKPDITLDQRLEAFRILASYDAAVRKANAKLGDDEGSGGGFTAMKKRIQKVA